MPALSNHPFETQQRGAAARHRDARRALPIQLQVFIGGKSYGGYTDLVALDKKGALDAILAGSAA